MRYLFTGGGTGGHVYPALAVADEIQRQDPGAEILYVGVKGRIEEWVVPQRGYRIKFVRSRPFPARWISAGMVVFLVSVTLGMLRGLSILIGFRPQVIVGTGGYASAPILFASAILKGLKLSKVKTFIHEQNAFPGLLNRSVARISDRIGITFEEARVYFNSAKVERVGYPVRREIARVCEIDKRGAKRRLGIPEDKKALFAFGGSQGSRTINRALVDALTYLKDRADLYIIHGIGRYKDRDYEAVKDTMQRLKDAGLREDELIFYRQCEYIDHIEEVYAASDLVICRGGAGTLSEVRSSGLPAIIVPMSASAGDHQAMNAWASKKAGTAVVFCEQADLEGDRIMGMVDGRRLAETVCTFLDDPIGLKRMSEAALRCSDRESLSRILSSIQRLISCEEEPPQALEEHVSGMERRKVHRFNTMSPFRLLAEVEHLTQGGACERLASLRDLDYLRYKTDAYLTMEDWRVRNVGVKLIGLIRYQEKLPLLLFMVENREPVGFLQRAFGGDFKQVGFIRRNALKSIWELGIYNEQVKHSLPIALDDPYYEVRSWAGTAVANLSGRIGADEGLEEKLVEKLSDPSFEVVCEAAKALGKIAVQENTLRALQAFYLHPNWKVREAVVRAFVDLLRRKVIQDTERLKTDMDSVLMTCGDFEPSFPLKRALGDLGRLLHQRETGDL